VLLALNGCAEVSHARNAYSAVHAAYSAKSAYANVKDLRDAQPVFAGYDSAVAYAEIAPRDKDHADEIKAAFADNIRYLVEQHAKAVGANLVVCQAVESCSGHIIGVQFREDDYNGSFAEKITMGDKLKGRLAFVDVASGRIVAEKRIEGVDSYAAVLGLVRGSIMGAMIKSFPSSSTDSAALNGIKPIKPGYEQVLAGA
jgi:hypothetical protein